MCVDVTLLITWIWTFVAAICRAGLSSLSQCDREECHLIAGSLHL